MNIYEYSFSIEFTHNIIRQRIDISYIEDNKSLRILKSLRCTNINEKYKCLYPLSNIRRHKRAIPT